MCIYSNIADYGRGIWPNPSPFTPFVPNVPPQQEWDAIQAFKDLLRKAEEFDKRAKQPDCEDPAKTDWLKALDERLARIEKHLGIDTSA